jgi:hypothetical protein
VAARNAAGHEPAHAQRHRLRRRNAQRGRERVSITASRAIEDSASARTLPCSSVADAAGELALESSAAAPFTLLS